jgi:hypothetical protein
MLDFTDIAVFIGMLLLRVGVPALVIVAIGYGLKRLDRRWEAEAQAYQAKEAAKQPAVQPEAPQPARRPGKQPIAPEIPFIPPQPPTREERPALYVGSRTAGTPGKPGTPGISAAGGISAKNAKCSTPSSADQPCWQARLKAEGHIPEECVACELFQRYPSM